MKPKGILTNMSPKAYVKAEGFLCPVCREETIIVGSTSMYSGIELNEERECETCKSYWFDHYVLIGYDDLKEGNENGNDS